MRFLNVTQDTLPPSTGQLKLPEVRDWNCHPTLESEQTFQWLLSRPGEVSDGALNVNSLRGYGRMVGRQLGCHLFR